MENQHEPGSGGVDSTPTRFRQSPPDSGGITRPGPVLEADPAGPEHGATRAEETHKGHGAYFCEACLERHPVDLACSCMAGPPRRTLARYSPNVDLFGVMLRDELALRAQALEAVLPHVSPGFQEERQLIEDRIGLVKKVLYLGWGVRG